MRRVRVAAAMLERSGLGPALRVGRAWRGVLVLCYHRILGGPPEQALPGPWSAGQDEFDRQLALLARSFDVVAPSELLGRTDLRRERLVAITFDDGYRDNHALALPVLRSRGVRAAFFIATGYVDDPAPAWWDEIAWMVTASRLPGLPAGSWLPRPVPFDEPERRAAVHAVTDAYKRLPGPDAEPFLDHLAAVTGSGRRDARAAAEDWMTWPMVRELRDAGMDVGGHTVSHPVLARLDAREQHAEIDGCRRRLHEELGVDMTLFSYPVGRPDSFDERTRASLARCGVRLAFALHGGYARPGSWDPYAIPRATVGTGLGRAAFAAMATLPQHFARW